MSPIAMPPSPMRDFSPAATNRSAEAENQIMRESTTQACTTRQDEKERDRILLEHLPLVRYLAHQIHERLPRHLPLEDLVNAGVIGLIDALNKFDHSKHVKFGCYARFRI